MKVFFFEIDLYTGSVIKMEQVEKSDLSLVEQLDEILLKKWDDCEERPSKYMQVNEVPDSVTFLGDEGSYQLFVNK